MPKIDSSFGIDEIEKAFARSRTGQVVGKISVVPKTS